MRKQALSLLVENTSSVLSHVSGLFSRRGYNIDSISAGVTADPRYTRITIVSSGDKLILEQIENQLAKLEDVLDIKKLEAGSSVTRELILVKLRVQESSRQEILSVIEIFRGKVVDVTRDSMVIELTGNQDKLSAFLDLVSGFEILELAMPLLPASINFLLLKNPYNPIANNSPPRTTGVAFLSSVPVLGISSINARVLLKLLSSFFCSSVKSGFFNNSSMYASVLLIC